MVYLNLPKVNSYSLGFCLSLAFFLIYLSTIPKGPTLYADSDLFLTLAQNIGLAHPPGYYLYIGLLAVVTRLPIPSLDISQKAYLFSSLLHSLTLFFTFQSVFLLLTQMGRKNKKVYLISAIATAMLATSFLFWRHSLMAEKYALNNCFASLLIFLSLRLLISEKRQTVFKYTALSISIFILSLHHHQTILLLLPAIFYVFLAKKR